MKLTLDECIEYAFANNVSLKRTELDKARALEELRSLYLDFLPKISAYVNHSLNWGRSVDMQELVIVKNALSQVTGASLGASLTVPLGPSIWQQVGASRYSLKIASAQIEAAKNALRIDISKGFLQLLQARATLDEARSSCETILQQRIWTELKVETGQLPMSELVQLESREIAEKLRRAEAEEALCERKLELITILGLPFEAEQFDVEEYLPLIGSVCNSDGEEHPALLSARLELERAKLFRKAAACDFVPKLTISAGYGSYYSDVATDPFRRQFSQNVNPQLEISLSIPIFNPSEKYGQARISVREAEIKLDQSRREIEREIAMAVEAAEAARKQWEIAESGRVSAEKLLKLTEAKYNCGECAAAGYIEAFAAHSAAVQQALRAHYRYVFQTKVIEFYAGYENQ
ncbi:MAG: TolC family protein [Bacteroidales bacterium]|nr:TolC family protein [Bacteroidales bacterium]